MKETPKVIDSFSRYYSFLSNFYYCEIEYEGLSYPSLENAYQTAKTLDTKIRKEFLDISPSESKKKGRSLEIRPNWDKVKIDIMYQLLCIKFSKKSMKIKLLETGDATLIEGNYWKDTFWGVYEDPKGKKFGQNHLGKLLMKIREDLKRENLL